MPLRPQNNKKTLQKRPIGYFFFRGHFYLSRECINGISMFTNIRYNNRKYEGNG